MAPDKFKSMIACSLSHADLDARLEEWRALRDEALLDETNEGTVFTSMWTPTASVRERLMTLIEAERDCCPFLSFEVEDGDSLLLRITVPAYHDGQSQFLLPAGLWAC